MDVRTLAITTAIGVGWGDILEVGGYLTSPSNTLGQFDGTYDPLGDALESLREQFPDLPVKMLENLLDDAAKAAKSTVPGPYMPEFSPWDFIGEEDLKDLYNQNLARTDPDGWGPVLGGNWQEELGVDAGYASSLGDTRPSAKRFTNDPGGFGLGPGSQFGGNSNGFGSSSGGGGGGGGGPKNTGTSGNPQKDVDLGGSVGSPTKADPQGRPPSDPKYTGAQPIVLDLDGNGVKIDELSRSTTFVDADGDGLKHRTAWAGAGDGVLFFDADGDGTLSERREYVFTEWGERRRRNGPVDRFRRRTRGARARTASSDLEALRSYFDTNGDGKLTAADAGFTQFRVLVMNSDGIIA